MVWYQVGATYEEVQDKVNYVLKRYHRYKKLWDEQFGEQLAEYALWDYAIDLEPGTDLRFFLMYKLTKVKI